MKILKSNVRVMAILVIVMIVLAVAICAAACSGEESSPPPETDTGTEDEPDPQTFECLFVDRLTDEVIYSQTVTAGTSVDFPDAPAHEHYEFSEWSCNGSRVEPPFFPTENCAIIAEYEILRYSYTFKVDDEAISAGEADALSEIDAPAPPEKDHMTFVGWELGGVSATFPHVLEGDAEFTAVYETNVYSYTFIAGGEVVEEGSAEALTAIDAPQADKEGYTFKGWTADGESVEFPYSLDGDTTFVAVFEEIVYPIIYELNGGVNDAYNPGQYTALQTTVTISDPSYQCRDFIGWLMSDGSVAQSGEMAVTGGTLTLTALWSEPHHEYGTDHVCTVCGDVADPAHVYQGSHICTICGHEEPDHIFEGGVCTMCGYVCTHEYGEDHICVVCKEPYGQAEHVYNTEHVCVVCGHDYGSAEHVYGEEHVCIICGAEHSPHVYGEDHCCTECGAFYGSAEHIYVGGACAVCGKEEVWDGVVADGFAGGSGSESDPYIITNAAELAYLAELVNGGNGCGGEYFLMTSDIYLGGAEWTPIGYGLYTSEGGAYPNAFAGVFDGGGHTVYGMKISDSVPHYDSATRSYYVCAGLFGAVCGSLSDGVSAAVVRNLGVERYTISLSGGAENAVLTAGGIAGYSVVAKFDGCLSSGKISAAGYSDIYFGGIVGRSEDVNYYGGITGCCAYSDAQLAAGEVNAGGIAGRAPFCMISYCAAVSDIDADAGAAHVAGIALGESYVNVTRCFVRTAISATGDPDCYAVTDGAYSECVCPSATSGGLSLPSSAENADESAYAEKYGEEGGTTYVSGRIVPAAFASDTFDGVVSALFSLYII